MISTKRFLSFRFLTPIPNAGLKALALALFLGLGACQPPEPVPPPPPSPAATPETPPASPPPTDAPAGKLLDDFEDKNIVNALGGGWFTYADKELGGDSTVSAFEVATGGANGSSAAGKMSGKVTKTYPYGFIALATSLEESGKPVDLTAYKGISFWAKGDGKPVRLVFQSPDAVKDFNYYGYVFTPTAEWQRFDVPFDQLTQEDWKDKLVPVPQAEALAKVNYIAWTTFPPGEPRETTQLELDDVQFLP
jgi:hypothetical protein